MRSADPEPPPAEPTPGTTASDAPAKPTRMVRSERQAGVVVAGVMVTAVALSLSSVGAKSITLTQAAIGLGFIALLAGAVWYGQRIIGSIAAIMAGLAPMKPAFSFLPFVSLAYGGFLMFRSSQAQKKAALARPRRPPRERAKAGPRSAKEAADTTGVRRPTANRRYTPPKSKGGTRRR